VSDASVGHGAAPEHVPVFSGSLWVIVAPLRIVTLQTQEHTHLHNKWHSESQRIDRIHPMPCTGRLVFLSVLVPWCIPSRSGSMQNPNWFNKSRGVLESTCPVLVLNRDLVLTCPAFRLASLRGRFLAREPGVPHCGNMPLKGTQWNSGMRHLVTVFRSKRRRQRC
jgi:hypothetical protein